MNKGRRPESACPFFFFGVWGSVNRKDAKTLRNLGSCHSERTREESIGDCSKAQLDGFLASTLGMTLFSLTLSLLCVFASLRFLLSYFPASAINFGTSS
jgi:hypothetical protein